MINTVALKNVLSNYVMMLALACFLAAVAAIFAASAYEEARKTRRALDDWFIKWDERTRPK